MTKTKHTPGPWEVGVIDTTEVHSELYDEAIVQLPYEEDTYYKARYPTLEEAQANASLVAASPDLLEALENLIDLCEGEGVISGTGALLEWADVMSDAQKAIQKAKGDGHK